MAECLEAFLAMAIPTWLMTVNHIAASILFIISGLCFVGSIYFGYQLWKHRRDAETAMPTPLQSLNGVIVPEKRLIIEVQDSDFGVSGDQGYPLLDSGKGKARWLRLGITFDSEGSGAYIETLELVISGKTPIQAFGCKPGLAGGGYYEYFQIPDWVKSGEHTIRVQAYANGTTWGSPEQIISFPA